MDRFSGHVLYLINRFWHGVGWFGVALLLYLSFTTQPPEIPVEQGDKIGHLLAYGTLMYWWSQLLVTARQRFGLAAALIVLGIAIEYGQGMTSWRTFEYFDMVADACGVALGAILVALTPNLLALAGRIGCPRQ